MKVYKINQYEAYRADEKGVRYSINEPGNDTVYYKSEVVSFDVNLPEGFSVKTNFLGDKFLKYGEYDVLIGEDNKGLFFEVCSLDPKKFYVEL